MWRTEELKTHGVAGISTASAKSTAAVLSLPQESAESSLKEISTRAVACLGEGIRIRGEITGSEDLIVDGEVEGKLELGAASLTVGPKGRVKAGISAREVVVKGRVEGPVRASERVHVGSTGGIVGDVTTTRLAIEEGGVVRGKIEAGRRSEKKATPSAPVAGDVRVPEEEAVEVTSRSAAD